MHFVSNVDGCRLATTCHRAADPETTLVVICSKTFTTLETHVERASGAHIG